MSGKLGKFVILGTVPRYLNRGPEDVDAFIVSYELGELTLKGWLYKPSATPVDKPEHPIDEPAPPNNVILVGHGGVGGIREHYDVVMRRLAKAGWTIIVPSYRGEDGSDGDIEFAKGEVEDTLKILELVDTLPWLSAPKVWLLGSSHGAIINSILAGRYDLPNFKGLILSTGVYDLKSWLNWLVESDHELLKIPQIADLVDGPESDIIVRSPVTYVESIKLPTLIISAGQDKMVPVDQSERMIKMLKDAGKIEPVTHHSENSEHDFIWGPDRAEAIDTWRVIIDFMNI